MTGGVRHVYDTGSVNRLLRSPQGGVARDLLRRGYRVEGAAKRGCPVDHGRLRSSITTRLISRDGMMIVEVGTDVKYARWVHDGTGIYGPRHARIFPRSASVMVFTPRKSGGVFIKKGSRKMVFARSTKGMRGTPFLRNAMPAARGR